MRCMFSYFYKWQQFIQYFEKSNVVPRVLEEDGIELSLYDVCTLDKTCAGITICYDCLPCNLPRDTQALQDAVYMMDEIDFGELVNVIIGSFTNSAYADTYILSGDEKEIYASIDGTVHYAPVTPTRPWFRAFFENQANRVWRAGINQKIEYLNVYKPCELRIVFKCTTRRVPRDYTIDSGRFQYMYPLRGMGHV
jgi:hypothetical protein